ncbi:MAG: hypothetical protein KDA91_06675 [Planctomycetaceae bacterium]|nr:hypothetical protein [Planctomycetaceae bacterium]
MISPPPSIWLSTVNALTALAISSTVILMSTAAITRRSDKMPAALKCRLQRASMLICIFPLLLFPYSLLNDFHTNSSGGERIAVVQCSRGNFADKLNPENQNIPVDQSTDGDASMASLELPAAIFPNIDKATQYASNTTTQAPSNKSLPEKSATTSLATAAEQPELIEVMANPNHKFSLSVEFATSVSLLWLIVAGSQLVVQACRTIRDCRFWWRCLKKSYVSSAGVAENRGPLRRVRIVHLAEAHVPMVFGVLRPVIVLPKCLSIATEAEYRMVVEHESAHILRHDISWNMLTNAIAAILWFQPLAWRTQRQIRIEQEHACDDAVLAGSCQPYEYAQLLTRLAGSLIGPRPDSALAVSMIGQCQLEQRVTCVLNGAKRSQQGRLAAFATASTYSTFMLLATTLLMWLMPTITTAQDGGFSSNSTESAATNPNTGIQSQGQAPSAGDDLPDDHFRMLGRVLDEEGIGVAGATVYLEGRHKDAPTAVSGEDGAYEMQVPIVPDRSHPGDADEICLRAERLADNQKGFQSYRFTKKLAFEDASDRSVKSMDIILCRTRPLSVTVMDDNNSPIQNASVGLIDQGIVVEVAETDAEGRAVVSVVDSKRVKTISSYVFALKDKFGLEFVDLSRVDDVEATIFRLSPTLPLIFRVRTPKPINAEELYKIEDIESATTLQPVAGVTVAPQLFLRYRFHPSLFVNSTLTTRFYPTTDANGEATISWVPADCLKQYFTAVEFANPDFPPLTFKNTFITSHANSLRADLTVDKMVNVTGKVLNEAGEPMPDTKVQYDFFSLTEQEYSIAKSGEAITNSQGRFSFRVPGRSCVGMHAQNGNQFSTAIQRTTLHPFSCENIVLKFTNSNRISGLVTGGPDKHALTGINVQLTRRFMPEEKQLMPLNRDFQQKYADRGALASIVATDKNGLYQIQSADGDWTIANPVPDRPRRNTSVMFALQPENRVRLSGGIDARKDFHSDTLTQLTIHEIRKLSAPPQPLPLQSLAVFHGFETIYMRQAKEDLNRRSEPPALLLPAEPRAFNYGGAYCVWDGRAKEITVEIKPRPSVKGQLVNASGKAAAGRSVRYVIHPRSADENLVEASVPDTISGQIDSDEHGKFAFDNFVQDCECEIQVTADEGVEWADQRWIVVATVTPNSAAPIDVGKLVVPEKIASTK